MFTSHLEVFDLYLSRIYYQFHRIFICYYQPFINGNDSLMRTYCFKCKTMREIINDTERVTENKRKLREGNCEKCFGNLALMGGYAMLPDSLFGDKKYDSEE
jgi:hypothetical protein